MSLLKEYKTLDEKEIFFIHGNNRTVNTISDVLTVLESYKQTGGYIFRGCGEAKYMMYNSAQRFYLTKELDKQVPGFQVPTHYTRFIENLIAECKNWNNKTLKLFLLSSQINDEDSLAYLSYMQHYGIPSPLLDFTANPFKALYFAIDEASLKPSNEEVDNYFSLYYCQISNSYYQNMISTFDTICKNNVAGSPPYNVVSRNLMSPIPSDNKAYRILNNTNIINQEGLFFYNSYPSYPLEESYLDAINVLHPLRNASISDPKYRIGGCFNIHKSLIPFIKFKLIEQGISEELLFPDIYKMKQVAIEKAVISSLTI